MLGKSPLSANALDQVASLPTREQVLAQIVGGVSSPVAGVGLRRGLTRGVRVRTEA